MTRDDIRGLYWNQGLFLTPQHFQLLEGRTDALLAARWRLLGPHGWGAQRLRLREGALEAGAIDIVACEVVLKDGTHVRAGEVDRPNATLKPKSYQAAARAAQGTAGLYLALPAVSPTGENVQAAHVAGGRRTRFTLSRETRRDLLDKDGPPTDVTFLELDLEVVIDADPAFDAMQEGYDLLKLAELVPMDGAFTLSRLFVPPSLTIGSSPVLMQHLQDVRDVLRRRAEDFAELKRDRGIRGTAGTPNEVMRTLILQTLNRQTGLLRGLLGSPGTHPADAYHQLLAIVAELSSFSEDYDLDGSYLATPEPQRLPDYDHERPGFCMIEAANRIGAMAKKISAGPEVGITLDFNGEIFTADIPGDFFDGRHSRYYLLIESDLSGPVLERELMNNGKLSSRDQIPHIRKLALFGLGIRHLTVAPEELPQRSSRYAYFLIDTTSTHWRHIQQDGTIGLYFTNLVPDECRVKLIKSEAA